jgi:hypothetical protein
MEGKRLSVYRHYLNLERVEARLERLLDDSRFAPVGELLPALERAFERAQRAAALQGLRSALR